MAQSVRVKISAEGDKLLDKIARYGGYTHKAAVLEVVIREAAHFRNITMEYEEDELRHVGYDTEVGSLESLHGFSPDELRQQIERFNGRTNVGDYQLSKLRVGGTDEFSKKKLGELLRLIDIEVAAKVREVSNASDKEQAATLRWILRGLSPELAIRKMELRLQTSQLAQAINQKGQD